MEPLFLRNKYIFGIILLLLLASQLEAAFEGLYMGARPIGMGSAFVSVSDDSNAILWNPAGLSQLKKIEIVTLYSKLYWNIQDDNLNKNFAGFVLPFDKNIGTLGVGWANSSSSLYCENVFLFSFGRIIFEGFSFGFNAKAMLKTYAVNDYTLIDPVFVNGNLAFGISFDFGMLYKITRDLSIGITVDNINRPDIHLQDTDKVCAVIKGGCSLSLGSLLFFKNILASAELDYYKNLSQDYKFIGGLESWFFDKTFAVRTGGGIGNNSFMEIDAGMSWIVFKTACLLQIDYAFRYSLNGSMEGTIGSHFISTTVKF
ncbi:MAG: hypothetical protein A2452_05380 [Candidatus Firestonebacteria bacterium RIFOXYC2_FULL_39_67]|nr:MAG: hypothetical protein A2536_10210 [Candidatus Firestonebacteria bacterium RIFOXYD2_FULL_39_29]OGF55899.1 MAG: hypothetical protein A2497_04875 [Candidatus Firestonebacteria bacterium RifOxyC12_full_39_7]OGF56371.1 MAG: hypothetical protein A2452_05380 [Candidatus Firestonebacteria bacterium RIFOXYC2_FULL_39_67]